MKGIFELKPPTPRYEFIWDVNIVLDYLKTIDENVSLEVLTHKLVMLLALATKQRVQTLHAISIDDINVYEMCVIIPIRKLLKHSRSGNYKISLNLQTFHDESLCVIRFLKLYLERTSSIRGNCKQLFISYYKPYKSVCKDTISRWVKRVMYEAGINTAIFKSHSTRSASTSAAMRDNVPVDHILKLAGWTNVHTFNKFYNKVVIPY